MKYRSITMYKTTFCVDCFIADRFFKSKNIHVNRIVNIDQDIEGVAKVLEINNGYKSVPTILIETEDNKEIVLVEPSWSELTEVFK